MSACRYRVAGVHIEPNVRGVEMRRLELVALHSDPFGDDATVPPNGHIAQLVTKEFAKRFQVGDEFDVIFREREA